MYCSKVWIALSGVIGAANWFSCLDPVFSLSSCAFEGTWVSSNGNRIKREPGLTRSECATECSNVGDCVAFTSWQTGQCDLYRKIFTEEKWVDTHIAFSVIKNRAANYNCPSATTTTSTTSTTTTTATTTSTALAAGRLGMWFFWIVPRFE